MCEIVSSKQSGWKWEAARFDSGPPRAFTIKEIPEIKAEIVKGQRKETPATKKVARGLLSGTQSRKFAATVGRGGRPNLSGQADTPVKSVVHAQDGFDLSRVEEKRASVPGPSRVAFVGPSQDKVARKKRAYRYMYENVPERSEVFFF
ncbi:hypothetical protein BD309DRAFT_226014 [Dichomitus squalens]|nr:hypothetical protein BD309DRAFT_226014 [Dichomitus squalens]